MEITSAHEIAKWFIKNGFDSPRNTFDGNMKLQKMLYFAQLIHLARYEQPLFVENILAFKNGSVIEEVRHKYQYSHYEYISSAITENTRYTSEQLDTMLTTQELFGELSASDLSEINHLHSSWDEAYEKSRFGSYHEKSLSIIALGRLIENEVPLIKEILSAHEATKEIQTYEVVNGRKFFYDPNQITINEEILALLESFNGPDSSYSIYKDETAGILIF